VVVFVRQSDSESKKIVRQRTIVAELTANATVRTSALARVLGVSSETVRRDIEELTARGLVNRTYGGAAGRNVGLQPIVNERTALAVEERRRIAATAARLVQPGDVIMVDSGSTTTFFAQALATIAHGVTLITNSFGVVNAIGDQPGVRVILCPGDFSPRERGVYGPETTAFLSKFNVDKAFIGASGMTADGPTDVETAACWVKRTMLARASATMLLADSSKFDRKHLEIVCSWKELAGLVVDQHPPALLLRQLKLAGVETYLAAPLTAGINGNTEQPAPANV
jgi:DeoR/GlpR family transcriptional regulator of sugar metabolism